MSGLHDFLQKYVAHDEGLAVWDDGRIHLHMVSYFCEELPPMEFVNSVRGIVFRGEEVLVMRNEGGLHIMPGGRREQGEKVEETLRRELLEEAGWVTSHYHLLGFTYFHHLTPKPIDYPYLFPDFVNLIFRASALEEHAEAKVPNDYELEHHFLPVEEVLGAKILLAGEEKWLEFALAAQRGRRV